MPETIRKQCEECGMCCKAILCCKAIFIPLVAGDHWGWNEDADMENNKSVNSKEITHAIILKNSQAIKDIELPEYGEVKIVCHAGKVTLVEITKKEKVE